MTRETRRLILLSIITLAFWLPSYFYVQILPGYVQYLGGSLVMVGLVGGAYGMTQALLRIPTGIGSDRLGIRKPFIFGGFIAGIVANLIFLTANNPWSLYCGQAMAGVMATNWVPLTVFAAGWVAPGHGTRTLGYLFAAFNVAQLIGATGGAMLTDWWGWHAPFLAGLLISCCGLTLIKFLGKETSTANGRLTVRALLAVGKNPQVLLAAALGILVQYGSYALNSFSPVIAERLGASHSQLGLLSLFNFGPTIVASYSVGWINKTCGRRRAFLLGMAFIIIGLATVTSAGNLIQLYEFMAFAGVGRGILLPNLMGLSQSDVPDSMKATAMGFFQALYAIGMFLGPTLSGFISDKFNLAAAFYVAAGLMLVPAIIMVFKKTMLASTPTQAS